MLDSRYFEAEVGSLVEAAHSCLMGFVDSVQSQLGPEAEDMRTTAASLVVRGYEYEAADMVEAQAGCISRLAQWPFPHKLTAVLNSASLHENSQRSACRMKAPNYSRVCCGYFGAMAFLQTRFQMCAHYRFSIDDEMCCGWIKLGKRV